MSLLLSQEVYLTYNISVEGPAVPYKLKPATTSRLLNLIQL